MREARQRRADRIREIEAGMLPGAEARRLGWDDLEQGIKDSYRVKGRRSTTTLEYRLQHLARHLGSLRATQITTARAKRYASDRNDEGAAYGTVNRELTKLKTALNIAHRDGKLSRVPFIEMLEEATPRQGFCEPAELAAIIEKLPEQHKRWPQVCFLTGWRKRSVLTLPRSARRNGLVYLEGEQTKNKEPVAFPDEGALKSVLDEQEAYVRRVEHRTGKVIPWMFCYPDGKPIKFPDDYWRAACKAAGKPGLTVHDLRRSAVRQADALGIPRDVYKAMAGIKTDSVYSRYNITNAKRKLEAARKLPGLPEPESAVAGQIRVK
ncbi:MAG: hypothetical protein JSV86_06870 [Gemmatimonadota bacterium]|nr:MAG: hypothetical protein JSV86_06870 [Gemmatimonadota bacterium]